MSVGSSLRLHKYFILLTIVSVFLLVKLAQDQRAYVSHRQTSDARNPGLDEYSTTDFEITEENDLNSANRMRNEESQRFFGTTQKPTDQGPVPIILLTYMRSGSSFLGDVLQSNPDVYYLFEPLHSVQFAVRDNETFSFVDGSKKYYDNFLEVASTTIEGLVTCNMEKIPLKMWINGFIQLSKKSNGMRACVANAVTSDEKYNCINKAKAICMNSKYSAFKIIRIPMFILEPIMAKISKLKIVHLLRDPRATTRSQNSYGVVRGSHLREDILRYCNRVYADIVTADHFNRQYPGRVMRLFYEDMAKDPISYAKRLYNFTGMEFTSRVESEIVGMTSAKHANKDCGQLCTKKSNSSAQAEAWRKTININFAYTVDSVCQPLYSKLGYKNIQSENELRNIAVSLRESDIDFDDFRYA